MKILERIIFVAIMLCGAAFCHAVNSHDNARLIDSLQVRLSQVNTPQDSLPILLNIYDLDENTSMMHVRRIFYAAKRAGNLDLQFDMIRQWVTFAVKWQDRGIFDAAMEEFKKLPETEDKRQTKVFIDIAIAENRVYKSDAERQNYLRQLLRECADMSDNHDLYDRIVKHFALVHLLQSETRGTLLSKYIGRLEKAIDALPPIYHNYIRVKFDFLGADNYWRNEEYMNSIKCERNLILLSRRLEKLYRKNGRMFKNYDLQCYYALRRILRNYEVLSEKEIRNTYDQMLEIVERNPEIAKEFESDFVPRVGIYDLEGRHAEAIPHIEKLVKDTQSVYLKRIFLRWLIHFATFAGNEQVRNDAERQNSELLDSEFTKLKQDERVRELALQNEVNNLRRMLAMEQLDREKNKTTLLYFLGFIIIALLIVFAVQYFRLRKRRMKYEDEISHLKIEVEEQEECRKEVEDIRSKMRRSESEKVQMLSFLGHELTVPLTAIINYSRLIVENANDDTREFMNHFASIIEVNADILQEVAKDLAEFQVVDGRKVPIRNMPVDVNALAEISIDSVTPRIKDGVKLKFTPVENEDTTILTDPRRVQIVLLSCISNMAMLTERGTISLNIDINREKKVCVFSITACGKQIPKDEAMKVFAIWEDFEDDAKIEGLGLPNCQVIIDVLGATLELDPDETNGTRLLFTLPILS